jgi:hypothetical protein
MSSSQTLEAVAVRLTEISHDLVGTERFGKVRVLRKVKVELEPVITPGVTYPDGPGPHLMRFKAPDTFSHFIIRLRMGWLARLRTRRMRRHELALEMWVPESQESWIHWLFPATTWEGTEGRSQTSLFGFNAVDDPAPNNHVIHEWAYWRTTKGPPQ